MQSFAQRIVCLIVLHYGSGFVDAALLGVGPWPTDSSSPPMNLYTIDESTGAETFLAATDVSRIHGLTIGSSGRLIALQGPNIYELDPTSGASTFIATVPFLTGGEGAVAYDPVTTNFYIFNAARPTEPDSLYIYNLTSDTGGVVGSHGFTSSQDVSAAAFDPNGVLYILHSDPYLSATLMMATVDVNTGLATTLFDTNITTSGVAGMVFNGDGQGYFTNGNELYSFDVSTSSTTLIGSHGGAGRISGLEIVADVSAVPEPASLFLAFLGLLGMGVTSFRREKCAR